MRFILYSSIKSLFAASGLLFQQYLLLFHGAEFSGEVNFLIVTGLSISFVIAPGIELAAYRVSAASGLFYYKNFMFGLICIFIFVLGLLALAAVGLNGSVVFWVGAFSVALYFWSGRVFSMIERVFGSTLKSTLYEPGLLYIVLGMVFLIELGQMQWKIFASVIFLLCFFLSITVSRVFNRQEAIGFFQAFATNYKTSHAVFSIINYLTVYGIVQFSSLIVSASEFARINLFVRWFFVFLFVESVVVAYVMPKYYSSGEFERFDFARDVKRLLLLFYLSSVIILFAFRSFGFIDDRSTVGLGLLVGSQVAVSIWFFPFYRFSVNGGDANLNLFMLIFIVLFLVSCLILYGFYSFTLFVVVLAFLQVAKNAIARGLSSKSVTVP